MKRLLLLFSLLMACTAAFAQKEISPAEIQSQYTKLYKNYQKNPNNVEAMVELAEFYMIPGNPMGSFTLAMEYICKAETRYVAMVEDQGSYRDVAKLIKKKITVASVRQLKHNIIDSTARYLRSLPDTVVLPTSELDNLANVFGNYNMITRHIEHQRLQGAFNEARKIGTLQSLNAFANKYPNTDEAENAHKEMVEMARRLCADAQWESEVDAIVEPYLDIEGMSRMAYKRKSTLAFAQACQIHTIEAYEDYLKRYPSGDEYADVLDKMESLLRLEYNQLVRPADYAHFAQQHRESPLADQAIAELRNYITNNHDIAATRIFLRHFPLEDGYDEILRLYYEWHLEEGNANPIIRFREEMPTFPYMPALEDDLRKALRKDSINLMPRFQEAQFGQYTQYIYRLTGRKISFVALQRTLQQLIAQQKWAAVIERMNKFDISFENDCVAECNELRAIVQAPADKKKVLSLEVSPSYQMSNAQVVNGGKIMYYNKIEGNVSVISMAQRTVGKKFKWQNIGDVQFTNAQNNGHLVFFNLFDHGTKMLLSQNGTICIATAAGDKWQISEMPDYPVNTDYNDYDAFMLPDGSGILLASDRPGGFNLQQSKAYFHGDTALASDIYFIPRTNMGWGEAINLGRNINSPYCEYSPVLSSDLKTLYFITDGRGGMGYGDIYMATRTDINDWQSWSTPVNYGKETNTGFNELSVRLSDDEKTLFLTSNSAGKYNCYSVASSHKGGSASTNIAITPNGNDMKIVMIDLSSQNIVAEQKVFTRKAMKTQIHREKSYVVIASSADHQFVPSVLISPKENQSADVNLRSFSLKEHQQLDLAIPLYGMVFSPNSQQLKPSATFELQQLSAFLTANPKATVEFEINVPGDDEAHCFNLGKSRGQQIKDQLILSGIDINRIIISNYGNVNYGNTNPSSEVLIRIR